MLQIAGVLAHLKWLTAFLAVVGVSLVSYHGLIPGDDYNLYVPLDSASGLYPGSDVLVAGSKAGTVQDIKLGSGDKAMVKISIEPDHAPAHSDATAALRPKSLLGEKYIAFDPGRSSGTLANNTTLSQNQIKRAVDLEEVVNTLDKPTREKLKTVVLELGGGLAGRGPGLNRTIDYGTKDMEDLAAVADTLRQRDADLEVVIQSLDSVLGELAKSDRRQELAGLIDNSQKLLTQLNTQDEQLKRALVETDAALTRTDKSLTGTSQNLNNIFVQLPTLVNRVDLLTGDLGSGFDTYLGPANDGTGQTLIDEHIQGIKEGSKIFGGKDDQGYATRISLLFGCETVSSEKCNPGTQDSAQPTQSRDPLSAINGIIFGGGGAAPAAPAVPAVPKP